MIARLRNREVSTKLTGGKGVVDSAFSHGRYPFLIESCQTLPTNATRQIVLVNDDATSLWQSSEWGMKGLQGSFPRLKDRFMYEEFGGQLLILLNIMHLYNFHARYVGMNQIRSVFMSTLEQYIMQPLFLSGFKIRISIKLIRTYKHILNHY
jgi:hypothetical protein